MDKQIELAQRPSIPLFVKVGFLCVPVGFANYSYTVMSRRTPGQLNFMAEWIKVGEGKDFGKIQPAKAVNMMKVYGTAAAHVQFPEYDFMKPVAVNGKF